MELARLFFYSVVRVVPDPVRKEALNVGVIVVDADGPDASAAFLRRFRTKLRLLDPWTEPSVLERLVDNLSSRLGQFQPPLEGADESILGKKGLEHLAETMKNQLQMSVPAPYRATSIRAAVEELFADLVSPRRKPPTPSKGMNLRQLKRVIRRTIQDWGGALIQIEEDKVERGRGARHHADFWVERGDPIAALIAIPDDPEERDVAWAKRDSAPTIAQEFASPFFKTVVVFPPNGHAAPTHFVTETMDFLAGYEGVLVMRADELTEYRDTIAPRLV